VSLLTTSIALAADDKTLISDAQATIATFKKTDPKLDKFFTSAAGYVVFPTIAKGIFFETASALGDFKKGNFALAAQASAVALSAGASANAKYEHGVAVFTATKGGLMYEASVGGQKFGYEPFKK